MPFPIARRRERVDRQHRVAGCDQGPHEQAPVGLGGDHHLGRVLGAAAWLITGWPAAGLVAITAGMLVLLGWAQDVTLLKSLNTAVSIPVQVKAGAGAHSVSMEVDDPKTEGIDHQVLSTVVVSQPLKYTYAASDTIQRNSSRSYFVTVPEEASTSTTTVKVVVAPLARARAISSRR